MPDEPISNPGVTPTSPTPPYGPNAPRLGEGEEAQPQKPFSLPPEPSGQGGAGQAAPAGPTPMDVARDSAGKTAQLPPEELQAQIDQLNQRLGTIKSDLQNPNTTNKFTEDHYEAMRRVVDKMNPDMRTIAKSTNSTFNPPEKKSGETVLSYVTDWINGSQTNLTNALKFLSDTKQKPNPASLLKLQYSVQRAVQRGELFASIVGASVSGIKTIMSTQLG